MNATNYTQPTRNAENRNLTTVLATKAWRWKKAKAVSVVLAAALFVLPTVVSAQSIVLSKLLVEVSEGGTPRTYTVQLSTKPEETVTVTVESSDTSAATVSSDTAASSTANGITLTFTTASWNTLQSVTVTGKDDFVDNPNDRRALEIEHTYSGGARTLKTLHVMVTDEDTARMLVTLERMLVTLEEPYTVNEIGTGNTLETKVKLGTKPTGTVIVTVESSNTSAATVSRAELTFTPTNYDKEQTVIVTGVNDGVDNDDRTVKIIYTPKGGGYGDREKLPIDVTVNKGTPPPIPGKGLTATPSAVTVAENRGRATYTVVLNTKPEGSVDVRLNATPEHIVTISPTRLEFTSANYDKEQTVTVIGEDDKVDQADDALRSASIVHSAKGGGYDGLTTSLTVTLEDDDENGLAISPPKIDVAEAGGTGDFEVRLNAKPTDSVTVTVASSDTNAATVAAPLTFTTTNWATAQTVTVTGVDDEVDAGDRRETITFSPSGGGYTNDHNEDVTVTVYDDDTNNLIINNTEISFVEDDTGEFTVRLNAKPTGSVTVTVASSDTSAATVDSPLTFTTTDWPTAKTVLVTGRDDEVNNPNNSRSVIITITPTTGGYDTHLKKEVTVKVRDDEDQYLSTSPSSFSVEEGKYKSYRVTPNTIPEDGEVRVTVTSTTPIVRVGGTDTTNFDDAAELTTLTFTAKTSQTVRVFGKGDDIANASRLPVTITNDPDEPGWSTEVVRVTVTDNEKKRGLRFLLDGKSVPRVDAKEGYSLALTDKPDGPVTVVIVSSEPMVANPGAGDTSVDIGMDTWEEGVSISVVSADIGKPGGSRTVTFTHTPSGSGYGVKEVKGIDVKATKPNTAALMVSPPVATIGEPAGKVPTLVRLGARPTVGETVTVSVSSSSASIATVSPATLTFTTANWEDRQDVVVTAVNDSVRNDPARTATISYKPRGGGYDAAQNESVKVTVKDDDDQPGVMVTSSTLTVSEGQSDTYRVALNTQPESDVTVTVTSRNTSIATVDTGSLTFTTSNWNALQPVTVTGMDDSVVNAGVRRAIITNASTSSDSKYASKSADVEVTVTDDDAEVTVSLSSVEVAEAGGTATYTVKLNGQPTGNVTVTVASDNPSAARVDTGSLTFTTSNWNAPQPVTVTGVNDSTPGGNRSATITHAASGGGFDDADVDSVSVTVTDDDGLTVTPAEVEVDEAGGKKTYTVRLKTQPTGTVTVAVVASGDTNAARVDTGSLTFTTSNWNALQTVTVTGVDDNVDNPGDSRSVTITNTSSGSGYASTETVAVRVIDDDPAPPGVTLSVSPTAVSEDSTVGSQITVAATVNGPSRYATDQTINVTVGGSDEANAATAGTDFRRVPRFGITIPAGAASATGTFTLTPIDDSEYEGNEIVTVAGAVAGAASVPVATARVTLREDDPPPTELSISGSRVNEGAAKTITELAFTVTKVVEPGKLTNRVVTVGYAVTGGTAKAGADNKAGADYLALQPGTLTFQPDDTSKTIPVTVFGDDVYEGDETIEVTLSSPTYATLEEGKLAVSGTIVDDDAKPELSIVGDRVDEGDAGSNTTLTFTVTKAGATSKPVTVGYAVTGGTAKAGADYLALQPGTLTFQPDDTSKTIPVTVMGDNIDEIDEETVRIALSDPTDATLSPSGSVATGIIVDDDDPPVLSISGSTVTEGHAGATSTLTFTVTKTGATSKLVKVAYADAGSGTATAGTDYKAIPAGTLSFLPGEEEATQTISVTVIGDNMDEYDETVEIALGQPLQNATLSESESMATGTILDDDDPPVLSIAGSSVTEGHEGTRSKLTFTVTKAGATSKVATVSYAVTGGTAKAGADYEALKKGTLTFQPADTSKTIAVTVKGDDVHEGDETVEVTLSSPENATLAAGRSKAVGTITDDDVHQTVARDWMARFGRTAANAAVDAIAQRVSNTAAGTGHDGPSLTLAGRRVTLAGTPALQGAADFVEPWEDGTARILTLQELAEGSSFDLERSLADGRLNVWGGGAYSSFEKVPQDDYQMSGSVATAIVGADHAGDSHVAGLALAYHHGQGEFSGIGKGGDLSSSLYAIYPYLRVMFGELFQIGGSFGIGTGSMSIQDAGDDKKVETGMAMTALGTLDARLQLVLAQDWLLAMGADVQTVHMVSDEKLPKLPALETATNRMRVGLESSYAFLVTEGVSLAPKLEAGLRLDGGDAETGIGVDVGGGVQLAVPLIGLVVDASGYAVLGTWNDASLSNRDWSIGGVIRWRPGGEMGPELSLAPAYGGRLGTAAPSLAAEIGYRMAVFGGVLTPYSAAEFSAAGQQSYRAGAHFELDQGIALSAEGTHRQPATGAADQYLTVQLRLLR